MVDELFPTDPLCELLLVTSLLLAATTYIVIVRNVSTCDNKSCATAISYHLT